MNKNFSLYLDFIRFFAAVLVLLHHFSDLVLPSSSKLFNSGHEAVVVFFILSGYVIAYTLDAKTYSARAYFVARFSRIYSVAIPAIILTVVLDVLGTTYCRPCYQDMYVALDYPIIRFLASITFTGELWFVSILSFGNIPYWSINYEVFFYVFFGLAVYLPKQYRNKILLLACLIAGPKILIMLPLWLMGVWLYRLKPPTIGFSSAIVLWLLTAFSMYWLISIDSKSLITSAFNQFSVSAFDVDPSKYLGPSRYFVSDYIFGAMFAINLYVSVVVCSGLKASFDSYSAGKVIRYLSARTFSLYLFHFPLLNFFNAVLPQNENNVFRSVIVLLLSVLCIFMLSSITEQRKGSYSKWLNRLIDKLLVVIPRAKLRSNND